jgi:hypothetical protein
VPGLVLDARHADPPHEDEGVGHSGARLHAVTSLPSAIPPLVSNLGDRLTTSACSCRSHPGSPPWRRLSRGWVAAELPEACGRCSTWPTRPPTPPSTRRSAVSAATTPFDLDVTVRSVERREPFRSCVTIVCLFA